MNHFYCSENDKVVNNLHMLAIVIQQDKYVYFYGMQAAKRRQSDVLILLILLFQKNICPMDPHHQQRIIHTQNSNAYEGDLLGNEGRWSLQNCLYFNDGCFCFQLDSKGCTSDSQKFSIYSNTYRILRQYKQWRQKQAKEQQSQLLQKQKNKPFFIQNHNHENLKNNQHNLDGYRNQSLQSIAANNQKIQQRAKEKILPNNNKNQLHLHSLYSMKIQIPKQNHSIYDQIPAPGQYFYKSTSTIPNQLLNDFNDQIPESTLSFLQSQRQNEDRLNEQRAYLRQQNMYLKEELSQIRNNHEQLLKQNSKAEILLTNDQINELIQQINSHSNQIIKLEAEKQTALRENGILAQNLQQIGKSNDELHKRLSSNVREIQRERKQNKKNMKDFEQRFHTYLQGQRQKFFNLQQELNQARDELQNNNKFISQCQKEINRLNKTLKDLEEQYESLMSEKDELLSFLQSSNKGQQQQLQIQQLLQQKQNQMQQLRDQLFAMEGEVQRYRKQAEQYEQKYSNQLQLRQQQLQIIENLDKQVQILKKIIQDKQASLVFQLNNTNYNKKKGMRNRSVEGISTCSASTINRVKVLCNEPTRKTIMGELRKLLRQIGNIQLENKICALVQQLYMDAEYRERSSIKLQEIIGQLEDRIEHLQNKREIPVQQNPSRAYLQQLEQSINRYERLLRVAEGEKMKLMEEVTALRKENHQIRLELADSDLDNETQRLIEQLTLQLEREKYSARELEEQNEAYHNEIVSLQKELYQKNKRLKLLGLNLNRKQGGQDIEVNVL